MSDSLLFVTSENNPAPAVLAEGKHQPDALASASGVYITASGTAMLETTGYHLTASEDWVWLALENGIIQLKGPDTDFMLNLSHQVSDGYQTTYTSDVASLGASRSFLKEKELSLGATLSLCYNKIKDQSKCLSMGGDLSVGYTLNKVHVFSLTAGVNKYGDVNVVKRRSSLDQTDVNVSLNYTYTFSLFELKRKAENTK